jgi:hypothetical protein
MSAYERLVKSQGIDHQNDMRAIRDKIRAVKTTSAFEAMSVGLVDLSDSAQAGKVEYYDATNWNADLLGPQGISVCALATKLGNNAESIKAFFPAGNIGVDIAGLTDVPRDPKHRIHFNNVKSALDHIYRAVVKSGRFANAVLPSPSAQLA